MFSTFLFDIFFVEEIERLRRVAEAALVYPYIAASELQSGKVQSRRSRCDQGGFAGALFTRGAAVFGHVFSERLYDSVGESHFMIYAIVGDCLL